MIFYYKQYHISPGFFIIGILLSIYLTAYSAEGYLLYTANINGNLEKCKCGPNITRGIGHIKRFFSEFRKVYSQTIIIDGGDYFNSYSHIHLNSAMLKALDYLDYDILVPGDHEFIEGMEFFQNYRSQIKQKFLASNLNLNTRPYFEFSVNNIKLFFYSFLSIKAFDFIEKPGKIDCHPFSKIKKTGEKEALHILVFHGPWDEGQDILKNNSWIDLLLLAHDQYLGSLQLIHQLLVGSGSDSEGVTIIKIKKKNEPIVIKSRQSAESNGYTTLDVKYQINWSAEYDIKDHLFLIGYARMNNMIEEDENIIKLINSYHHSKKNNKTRD